eukprot:TRINITY_DN3382_c0_g1_i2.p1 TRINITY_DN3382_c0_g1~~TRINITY_DN3382_c0_g1_i2.p1  ORF type:complete len:198 (+),score=58.75 TRINITY_DN3382_c0_g1_i2:106-699(+)
MALKVFARTGFAAWSRPVVASAPRLAALPAWQQRFYSSGGVTVGDSIPSVSVQEGDPGTKHDLTALFAGKKGILFGVPGAFTPTCSNSHLPSYLEQYDQLKAKGIEEIACISVNDVFVMKAWGDERKVEGKIRMVADPQGEASKALGLLAPLAPEVLGNPRCKRFSMLIEDNIVKAVNLEEADGLACTLSPKILEGL